MFDKTIDLFSGCGGMSLGFQNAGFTIIAAFDKWKPAVDIYRLNFQHPIYEEDLAGRTVQERIMQLAPDIIIGGPPCQDYSPAGCRNESRGRAVLTYTYRDIIDRSRPKYFVMENVPEIKKSPIFKEVRESFKAAGYGLTERVLNASFCGVPQSRKRFFLIGCLGAEDDFLGRLLDSRQSQKPMTVADYLGDSLGTEYFFIAPRNYNRRGVFSIHEPCATIRGTNRPIPPGYQRHHNDRADISVGIRPLTAKERSYIQTFPESFVFQGTKTNVEQAIGNAVPVKLAEYVATCIQMYEALTVSLSS